MHTRIWLNTSGGVIIAETASKITRVYLRFLRINPGVIKPTLVKKNRLKMGNSKTSPTAKNYRNDRADIRLQGDLVGNGFAYLIGS